MWKMLVIILRDIGLISLFIILLTALGVGINAVVPWIWLTNMFSIIKFFSSQIDFLWDTTTMWTITGLIFGIEIIKWSFKAGITVIKWFKN